MDPFENVRPSRSAIPEGRAKLVRAVLAATRVRDLTVHEGAALLRNTSDEAHDWQAYYKMLDRL